MSWISLNSKDFGGDGGFLCQDCGQPLTMNSHSKHTRDKCPYWKEKRKVEGRKGEGVEEKIVRGYADDNQDGFQVQFGGADGESDESSSHSGSDEESEQGSDSDAAAEESDGEPEKGEMSGEGSDGEPWYCKC